MQVNIQCWNFLLNLAYMPEFILNRSLSLRFLIWSWSERCILENIGLKLEHQLQTKQGIPFCKHIWKITRQSDGSPGQGVRRHWIWLCREMGMGTGCWQYGSWKRNLEKVIDMRWLLSPFSTPVCLLSEVFNKVYTFLVVSNSFLRHWKGWKKHMQSQKPEGGVPWWRCL